MNRVIIFVFNKTIALMYYCPNFITWKSPVNILCNITIFQREYHLGLFESYKTFVVSTYSKNMYMGKIYLKFLQVTFRHNLIFDTFCHQVHKVYSKALYFCYFLCSVVTWHKILWMLAKKSQFIHFRHFLFVNESWQYAVDNIYIYIYTYIYISRSHCYNKLCS